MTCLVYEYEAFGIIFVWKGTVPQIGGSVNWLEERAAVVKQRWHLLEKWPPDVTKCEIIFRQVKVK